MSSYRLRPLTAADLPMLARWLRIPEVARWWGDPREQLALLAADLGHPLMRQWIVELGVCPFAYVQAHPAYAWPQSHLSHLPRGAELIDTFIGEPSMLGHGHGSAVVRTIAEMLLAEGAPAVAIDPDLNNHRARRAYARAGFVAERIVETETGPSVLMLFSAR